MQMMKSQSRAKALNSSDRASRHPERVFAVSGTRSQTLPIGRTVRPAPASVRVVRTANEAARYMNAAIINPVGQVCRGRVRLVSPCPTSRSESLSSTALGNWRPTKMVSFSCAPRSRCSVTGGDPQRAGRDHPRWLAPHRRHRSGARCDQLDQLDDPWISPGPWPARPLTSAARSAQQIVWIASDRFSRGGIGDQIRTVAPEQ